MRFPLIILSAICIFFAGSFMAVAGPPFRTDDPEPVEYRHWEVYIASAYQNNRDEVSFTAPHIEINYGAAPNLQIHLIAPMEYVRPSGGPSHYGYADTELGFKYRFYENKQLDFQAGVFPLVEIPTGDESRGLGNGDPQGFLPIWFQKGCGPWTTYGGGGYWINPGRGHRDYWFVGWEVQRELTKQFTLGAEVFHQASPDVDGEDSTGFNVGGIFNLSDHHHILFSAGRDFSGPNNFSYYLAYQYTFGPGKPKETEEK